MVKVLTTLAKIFKLKKTSLKSWRNRKKREGQARKKKLKNFVKREELNPALALSQANVVAKNLKRKKKTKN